MKDYNVLLIMTDQHRYDCNGFNGNAAIDTPALDWLASLGTVFDNAYSPSPMCIPARACLMTGMTPWKTGVLFNSNSAGPHLLGGVMGVGFENTLAGELSKNDYHTQGIGKMHFFPQRATLGFDRTLLDESGREEDLNFKSDYKEWFLKNNPNHSEVTDHGCHWNSYMARSYHADESFHPTNWTANESINFLKKRDPSRSFFLKMSFARPHSPYDPCQYFFDMYKDKDLPKALESEWSKKYEDSDVRFRLDPWCGKLSSDRLQRQRAGYYGSITQIDYQVAKVLMFLFKAKLLDETLIIFTSDHGDMLGDHNLFRKGYAYEGSTHIPMIIKLPKSLNEQQVRRTDEMVSLYDIMPTILDCVGLETPKNVEGASLVDVCCGGKPKGGSLNRDYVHGEQVGTFVPEEDNHFIVDKNYKYIWFSKTGAEALFDISKNKNESDDLAKDKTYEEVLLKYRNILIEELQNREQGDFIQAKDGKLLTLDKEAKVVSPHYVERLRKSHYKWL